MPINHQALQARFTRMIFHKREAKYLNARDRDQFLNVMKVPLLNYLQAVVRDSYFGELIQIYALGQQLDEPDSDLLPKAEKCREKWAMQDFAGTEYNQPYIPVHKDVHKEHPRYITKFIAQCGTAHHFLKLIIALEKARKRGGLHEREELKILSEAKKNEELPVTGLESETGFTWVGLSTKLRIDSLYQRLRKEGYIDRQTSSEQFHKIFSGEPVIHPVVWLKTNKLLLYFTDRLIDKQLVKLPTEVEDFLQRKQGAEASDKADGLKHVSSSWQYARIAACFISKTKRYTATGLKHQRNDIDNKTGAPPGSATIKRIVDEIASLREENEV